MPADSLQLNPPAQYSWLWLLIAIALLVAIVLWRGYVYWSTRKRKITSAADLPALYDPKDLAAIKQKYLKLIDQCYASYQKRQTNVRGLHRGLSMTVRYFVYEAKHFPAPRLTLSDLQKAPYPELEKVVGGYYAKEFAQLEHGSPEDAVRIAKEMVQSWV